MTTAVDLLHQARRFQQGGNLAQAEALCRQALQSDPQQGEAWHLLGLIASQVGRHDLALDYAGQALRLNPGLVEAYNLMGVSLALQGKLPEAAACYQQAVQLRPAYAEAHNNLGLVLQAQGKWDEAAACYRQALGCQPNFADACNNLGVLLQMQGKLEEAAACFRRAVQLKPDLVQALNNLGKACKDQGRLDEALACCQRVVQLQPADAEAHNNLGLVLQKQGRLEEAVACYQEALRRKPDHAEVHSNLGAAFQDLGRLDEAVVCHRQALRLKPEDVLAHNNLGAALADQGRLDEAVASYTQALLRAPENAEIHRNRAAVWLSQGDHVRGWPEYEWRLRCPDHPPRSFAQPRWDGSPLAGRTILLHAEQGLGDTLQFICLAPLVQQRGGRVVVECQAPLLPLLARCAGIDQLVAQGEPLPPFDVEVPLLSLPGILGTTLETLPASVPYLHVEASLVEHWRGVLGSEGFKVGIAWQGNPGFPKDRWRSLPLACFAPVAAVPGVRLFSLQKGAGLDQLAGAGFPVTELGSRLQTYADTAAVMRALDLVVTSDTSVPHCAGGLGVPVWVALSTICDWRWLRDREDCPWYPSARLFRQSRLGQWQEVFARMAEALRLAIS